MSLGSPIETTKKTQVQKFKQIVSPGSPIKIEKKTQVQKCKQIVSLGSPIKMEKKIYLKQIIFFAANHRLPHT